MNTILTNDPVAVLAVAMDATQLTLTVADGSEFPAGGKFHVRIDDEILWVTAVSGVTWTVTRAAEVCAGVQTAATHAVSSNVYGVLTVDAMTSGAAAGDYVNPVVTLDAYGRILSMATGQNHFFAQHGVPSSAVGNVGDFSVDLDTSIVYQKV